MPARQYQKASIRWKYNHKRDNMNQFAVNTWGDAFGLFILVVVIGGVAFTYAARWLERRDRRRFEEEGE